MLQRCSVLRQCSPELRSELAPTREVGLSERREPVNVLLRLRRPMPGGSFSWAEPLSEQKDHGEERRSSAAPACPPRLVGCTVVEEAFVCPTGGGFENETWRVQVNDAWLTIAELVRRRSVGDVAAELVDGHDPNGVESSGTLPPQTAFHRRTYVVAPVGTRFWKRVIRPVIDRTRTYHDYLRAGSVSVVRQAFEHYFVLRGPERLVSLALDIERRSSANVPAVEPVTREQAHQHAKAILNLLGSAAPPTSRMK